MEKVLFLDSPMKEKPYGSIRIQEKFGFGPMDKKDWGNIGPLVHMIMD